MNTYLIPANSKKSLLIFGWFNKFDLILFGSGVGITLLMMMIVPVEELLYAIIAILPAAVTLLLVLPIPNYHNVLTVIVAAWNFVTIRKCFIWKGWCLIDGEETNKK